MKWTSYYGYLRDKRHRGNICEEDYLQVGTMTGFVSISLFKLRNNPESCGLSIGVKKLAKQDKTRDYQA